MLRGRQNALDSQSLQAPECARVSPATVPSNLASAAAANRLGFFSSSADSHKSTAQGQPACTPQAYVPGSLLKLQPTLWSSAGWCAAAP